MAGYILKISLEGTRPPVWRRIVIPEDITFSVLHEIIQIIYDWDGEHLHEFSTNEAGVFITDEAPSAWNYQESKTRVNEFLTDYKWIRYTYDFGDDWRHKIVLEKEDPAYQLNYAQVLKYRGDNFIEDFVWDSYGESEEDEEYCDCSNRSPFDLNDVNRRLKNLKYHYSQKAPAKKSWTLDGDRDESMDRVMDSELDAILDRNSDISIEDFFRILINHAPDKETEEAVKTLRSTMTEIERLGKLHEKVKSLPLQQSSKNTGSSKLAKMSNAVRVFCVERQQWAKEHPDGKDIPYQWELNAGSVSMVQALTCLNRTELTDYCKYWGISVKKNASKAVMAELLYEEFAGNPKSICYVFTVQELQELFWIQAGTIRQTFTQDQNNCILKAIALGLLQAEIISQGDGKIGKLALTAEASDLLGKLKKQPWKRMIKQIEAVSDKIMQILYLYEVLDFDFLYRRLTEWWKLEIDQWELDRILYCHINFGEIARTCTSELDQHRYLMANELNTEQVLYDMYTYASDMGEYPFTLEEVSKMGEGFNELYPCWDVLYELLLKYAYFASDTAIFDDRLNDFFILVLNGGSSTELFQEVHNMIHTDTHGFQFLLWNAAMACCMNTGLPMLKGYTRRGLSEQKHMPVSIYRLFTEKELVEKVQKDTPIYLMPCEIQMELYQAMEIMDLKDSVTAIQAVQKQLGVNNYEIQIMILTCHINQGEFGKAEPFLRSLKKELGNQDPYVNEVSDLIEIAKMQAQRESGEDILFDSLSWPNASSGSATYRRNTPKVGRNDPCPCGSGKKYKKCCGRGKENK